MLSVDQLAPQLMVSCGWAWPWPLRCCKAVLCRCGLTHRAPAQLSTPPSPRRPQALLRQGGPAARVLALLYYQPAAQHTGRLLHQLRGALHQVGPAGKGNRTAHPTCYCTSCGAPFTRKVEGRGMPCVLETGLTAHVTMYLVLSPWSVCCPFVRPTPCCIGVAGCRNVTALRLHPAVRLQVVRHVRAPAGGGVRGGRKWGYT